MKGELEGKDKALEDSAKEIEKLKKELKTKNQELLENFKLEAHIEALQKRCNEEYELNVLLDNYLPTLYTNFWWSKRSLTWLKNYEEAMMSIYDIIKEDERQEAEKMGWFLMRALLCWVRSLRKKLI